MELWPFDGLDWLKINRCTRKMLPALFDWSIIGCTILRLALMNLEQKRARLSEAVRPGSAAVLVNDGVYIWINYWCNMFRAC